MPAFSFPVSLSAPFPFSFIASPLEHPTTTATARPGANPLFERVSLGAQIPQILDPPSSAEHATNPFSDTESYLLLYDLCRGDIALLETIRDQAHTPPVPPILATTWDQVTPIPVAIDEHTPLISDTNPTLYTNLLSPVVAHPPSQDKWASASPEGVRYKPYSTLGKSKGPIQSKSTVDSKPSIKPRRRSQRSKEDYIKSHGVKSIKRLDGLDNVDLNSPQVDGQWREILVDALQQIGVPYSLHGLKRLIAQAYGLKIIRGQKKHPENRWQHHMSYHFCQNKQKAGAASQQAGAQAPLFVKLENELYSSTYWWLAGRPIPRHCDGFPEGARLPVLTTKTPPDSSQGTLGV